MVRETRHLWVGNLPENVREEKIIEHFKRYGRVESVKILPKRGSEGGVAAFVDFVDIKSAQKAHNSVNKMGDRDLRTDYNEPGTIPSAARGLDDTVSIGSRTREVSGFRGGGGGAAYGPPASLHGREGRYERRLDGTSETRDRTYEHSAYGHHERGTAGFERTRHYDPDYYRPDQDRTLPLRGGGGGGSGGSGSGGGGGAGSSGSTSGVYYGSRSRSPSRFETPEPRYEPRPREPPFTLASVVHRDLYRDELSRDVRGRRTERGYQHSRSRSPHSSQSRNPSPQRLTSQPARPTRSPSGSGSRSRSSSSDSVSSSSSTSSDSDSSSSSSDESPARSVLSAAVPAPPTQPPPALDKDEPRKSFGIKVQNLPVRSTDTSLKDGLFHEFKKYGKVTSVQIHGALEERYGLVFFRQEEDQEKALNASKGKLFFGMQIEVTAWTGPETESENEFRPLDERIDEFHPKATRTLFIGNLEKTTSYHDLLNIFQRFGEIVDIDIKKVNGAPQYAFLQYCDIASVCKAIKKMDGEYLGNNRLKLGFGKSMPTTCVWLDGLASNITEQYLTRHFCRYGHVVKVVFDRLKGMALVLYNNIEYAQAAVKETKGWKIGGNKIKVDFANQESQMAFYRSMQASGQDIRDFYEILTERRDERRPPFTEFSAERAFYENPRTPGTYTEDPRREYPARSREFYAEWDPYQGDYYDPRHYEDPREFRDFRDPYEQDIRKYSYLQRERERERERFETDRERDHTRRTIERSQSPNHPRRTTSTTASPSPSERLPSDSERRIYSRSSERSGSCSSLSPPRYEKPDKVRPERYPKNDKAEKDRPFDAERVDKEKRAARKEKVEKDKTEKQKLRKVKAQSPSIPSSETDPEPEREPSPDTVLRRKNKSLAAEKDGANKNRLDLLPCVVLTRVKEKEGKVLEQPGSEKQRLKVENDSVRSPPPPPPPPPPEQKIMLSRLEQPKGEVPKPEPPRTKVPKEKVLASHVEVVEKEAKIKPKKHVKAEPGVEGANSLDIDRLEARKRRFADANLKSERQLKRSSQDEEEGRLGLKKLSDMGSGGEGDKKILRKEQHKKEHRKAKPERLVTVCSPKDGQEAGSISVGIGLGLSLDLQARLGEQAEDPIDPLEFSCRKVTAAGIKAQHRGGLSRMISDDLGMEDDMQDQEGQAFLLECEQSLGQEKGEGEEKLPIDIDHSQSYRKQMEQSRRLKKQQQLQDVDTPKPEKQEKPDKPDSPKPDVEDFERRSLVHEVGKPPEDVTDDSPPSKRKKVEAFDFELSAKRERNYRSSRQLSEDSERNLASLPGLRLFPFHEDEGSADSPRLVTVKETKESPKTEVFTHLDLLKFNPCEPSRREPPPELPKLKAPSLSCEEDLQRWGSRIKQESIRLDVSFPSSIVKREGIRKRSLRELEPGEVPSDSDEDGENKTHSPKASTSLEGSRLSYFLREREERLSDLKLSSSLERNKFYSFALDQTITPDTKALLERAKSLSSSREENWSFLDRDSRFASFRNSKDKEKVESAPRPIPSWYMKKKKIRTDSEGKLDDKKEEPKAEEQEKRELFASRFLHSSIFEQDSRRLQHLERKEEDTELFAGRLYGRQASSEGLHSSEMIQEPVVLFHSRFMEFTRMQQKEKEKEQRTRDTEKLEVETEDDRQESEQPGAPEPAPEADIKPVTPVSPVPIFPVPREPPQQAKATVESLPVVVPPILLKEEKTKAVLEKATPQPQPQLQPQVPVSIAPMEPASLNEAEIRQEPKGEALEARAPEEETLNAEHPSYLDTKPPTPGASFTHEAISLDPEPEVPELINPVSPKPEEVSEEHKEEIQQPEVETLDNEAPQRSDESSEAQPQNSDNDMEVEPVVPARKPPKSKRAKTPPAATQPAPVPASGSEKPATRKSERIDREKLKRASSPRGEAPRAAVDPKTSAKSPSHATDSESSEPNLPVSRTRRRNVRSVYATPVEDDTPQTPGKDLAESPRSTRKRGDKEPQQDTLTTPTTPRRGRPPKTRRRGEDVSPVKGDGIKPDADEPENKEGSEVIKPAEGWRSPRSQKSAQSQSSPPTGSAHGRKGGKAENKTPEIHIESVDEAGIEPLEQHSPPVPKLEEEPLEEISKAKEDEPKQQQQQQQQEEEEEEEKKDMEPEKNMNEGMEKVEALIDKCSPPEKGGKAKGGGRATRNAKSLTDDKSLSLKNLEIRLSVDDVKGVLQTSEEEPELLESSPKKPTPPPIKDEVMPQGFLKEVTELNPEKEEPVSDTEPPADPAAALLARQMELEQAVENIAKLTEGPTLPPYKEPPPPEPELQPMVVEPEVQDEVEKPANPASETELAAAIDSITAEDISADADSFPAPGGYTTLTPPDPLDLPPRTEATEPETHLAINNILEPEPEVGSLPLETKSSDPAPSDVSTQEESPPPGMSDVHQNSKKRQKSRKNRSRRGSTNRKGDPLDGNASEPEPSTIKPAEPVSEDIVELEKPTVVATPTTAAAAATRAVASCKQEARRPKETETPVEQPELRDNAYHSGNKSPTLFKLRQLAESATSSLSTPPARLTLPPPRQVKLPSSPQATVPEWLNRPEESQAPSNPPPQAPQAAAAPAPMPPDTKASDIDPSSSTLRKILMEPKYVSATSGGIPSTQLTTCISEPVSSPPLEASKPLPTEEKPVAPPPTAEAQRFNEKPVSSVISHKAISVISHVPLPFDSEETPRITLGNRAPSMSLPKQKYRASMNENNRYPMGPTSMMGVEEGRPVESAPFISTGSGLRVNTSEGVVVLSYSGQKTEGPQRISAKISQIPPASAVDIEFQQSVSKSQIKQEPLTPSQQPTTKGSQMPTGYGPHSTGVHAGQPYNTQGVISAVKQESPGGEKSDPSYHSGPQSAAVKIMPQTGGNPPVLVYNPLALMHQQATKKGCTEPVSLKVEPGKPAQPTNLSPGLSPHHPSLTSNHVGSGPSTPTERSLPHLGGVKQEPHSPRTCGHSPSPFSKVCQPSSTASVVLGPGISMPQYVSSVHHPEQSVIMPPHSVTQSVSLGHITQGEVRMNTPPLPGMPYGIRSETLSSPRSGLQTQRSSTPQPAGIRDMVLQPIPSGEDDVLHYHQGIRRPSTQMQPDMMVMQPDYRLHHGGMRLDQYNMAQQDIILSRDVRMIMHQQMGDQHHPDSRQARTPESSVKTPPASKTPQPGKETPKPAEVKLAPSPHSEARIMGVSPGMPQLSQPVMVSHGVQLMHSPSGSYHDYPGVYRDMRNFQLSHPQFPGPTPLGMNLPPRSITPSQGMSDGEHGHASQPIRSKTPQVSVDPKGAGGPDSGHLRHTGPMDPTLSHLQRVQSETGSPSYPSPVSISLKHDLPQTPGQKPQQQQPFPQTSLGNVMPGLPPGLPTGLRPDTQTLGKQEHSHRPVDMVQLLTKYPIVWQGLLALKNDTAAVQLHFVSGNNVLAHRSLPAPEGGPPLRIAQRMRLEASQLEGVARRMTVESDYCLLLALPCGRDQDDVLNQTESLKAAFISYLQAKLAAGIINVPNPGSNQPAYVLQIFPPCEFSESHLSRLAPDLLASISSISPHLMIVIASV
ncbi:msx2-interacting protein-like isoform X2 [Acipenser ruthenus]|uniref:msx2-interacting protein-like isoform X2 n=1 Tax=Acipenser ruthenus TaxID=7906 RepID=UPI0027427520|nr:msx2-interacting protein-like isoform X2 [Acipenser ruthenus]